jgi:hypothetical protein
MRFPWHGERFSLSDAVVSKPLRIAATCDPVAVHLRTLIGSEAKSILLFRVKYDHMIKIVCGRLHTVTLNKHE